MANKLTKTQIKQLGERLVDTTGHVFHVAQALFGISLDQSIFERLEKEFGIFRCVECSVWKDADNRQGDYCDECMANIEEEEDD